MARGNTYTCRACGKTYDYCESCGLLPIPYLGDGFCCLEHSDIFAILSKHGCGLATAKDTLDALKKYDLTGLSEGIKAHIDAINKEVKPSVKVEDKKEAEVLKKFRVQE